MTLRELLNLATQAPTTLLDTPVYVVVGDDEEDCDILTIIATEEAVTIKIA